MQRRRLRARRVRRRRQRRRRRRRWRWWRRWRRWWWRWWHGWHAHIAGWAVRRRYPAVARLRAVPRGIRRHVPWRHGLLSRSRLFVGTHACVRFHRRSCLRVGTSQREITHQQKAANWQSPSNRQIGPVVPWATCARIASGPPLRRASLRRAHSMAGTPVNPTVQNDLAGEGAARVGAAG